MFCIFFQSMDKIEIFVAFQGGMNWRQKNLY